MEATFTTWPDTRSYIFVLRGRESQWRNGRLFRQNRPEFVDLGLLLIRQLWSASCFWAGRRRDQFMMFEAVTRRVLAEFDEMPGLTLTPRQAARLFGLDPDLCRRVLDSLIDTAYLRETGGTIRRGDRIAA